MSRWGYLIFGLLSLFLSAISVFLWVINPFTEVFLLLAAPPLRLLGYHPPVESWSGLGERHVSQLLLAAHAFAFALVEFPGAAVEDLGLCRVAPVGKRDHRLVGATGEGRLLTCCD
jgi:hypothetical protein